MGTVSRTSGPPGGASLAESDRVAWVDAAKGIAIILVVAMHATLGVGAAAGGEGWMHGLVAATAPFRMPALFLVSGLFLSRVIERDWRSYADKRVVHFAYFYVLWLVIQSGFKAAQIGGGEPAGFAFHLAASLVQPWSTLWFIYLLAVLSVLTKLVRRAPAPVLLGGAALLQILPVETGLVVVDETCRRWVYFLAGYLLAPRVFAATAWAVARPVLALGALAVWASATGALALTPFGYGRAQTLAGLPVVSLALGLSGALAVAVVAALLSRARLAGPLRFCGAHAIAIYLAFFLPMAASRAVLVRTGLVADVGTASLLVTICAIVVPLALAALARGTRFAFLFERPGWARLARRKPGSDVGAGAAASRASRPLAETGPGRPVEAVVERERPAA